MAKWWWTSAADRRARLIVAASAAALALAACSDRTSEGTDASGRPLADGTLPTPAGTSGGSVTGMPTSAPPRDPAEAVVETPAPEAGEIPADAPLDPNAVPIDPATGMAAQPGTTPAGPPTSAADVSGAGSVVREYMAALGSGAFAGAQQLWSTTPNDSAVLQLARGTAFAVDVLAPVAGSDPAAGVATVPVRVRGANDGGEVQLSVAYTVRRTPEGTWRIASATVREESP